MAWCVKTNAHDLEMGLYFDDKMVLSGQALPGNDVANGTKLGILLEKLDSYFSASEHADELSSTHTRLWEANPKSQETKTARRRSSYALNLEIDAERELKAFYHLFIDGLTP